MKELSRQHRIDKHVKYFVDSPTKTLVKCWAKRMSNGELPKLLRMTRDWGIVADIFVVAKEVLDERTEGYFGNNGGFRADVEVENNAGLD